MLVVVPGDKVLTETTAVLDRTEALGKVWPVLHGPELAFRVRIVIGNMRATVCFGDAKIGQQKSHRLGFH